MYVGASTADVLTRRGKTVLLIEQFGMDHNLGSSAGDGRIFRFAYPEPLYVELSKRSLVGWRDLERRTGEELLVTTGGLDFGPIGAPTLQVPSQCPVPSPY